MTCQDLTLIMTKLNSEFFPSNHCPISSCLLWSRGTMTHLGTQQCNYEVSSSARLSHLSPGFGTTFTCSSFLIWGPYVHISTSLSPQLNHQPPAFILEIYKRLYFQILLIPSIQDANTTAMSSYITPSIQFHSLPGPHLFLQPQLMPFTPTCTTLFLPFRHPNLTCSFFLRAFKHSFSFSGTFFTLR